jgi:conjugative relaxase-like TrwC/TraI family protein
MLGIGKISSGGDAYYLEAVARGAEEYYRGVGEAPGQWTGNAAVELGLGGEVDPADLRAVWSGLDPRTGTKLGCFPNRTVHVFDLTFKAPKSVSVIYGLGDPEISRAVRDAHDAAVAAAVAYVEREAVRSRCGKGGLAVMEVSGLVAARFRHRTSRAGDPHLHTHVLAANLARGVDGKWRTLDGRMLFAHALTAGYLYQAHLRHELTTRLGVDWGPVTRGTADVVGIDRSVIEGFSDRRRQIQERLDQVGFRSARAAQLATLDTRPTKDKSIGPASMRAVWHAKADELGFDPATIADVLDRRRPHEMTRPQLEALFTHLAGPTGLTRQASTFDRRDVLRALAEQLPTGAPVTRLERLVDEFLDRPDIVPLVTNEGLDTRTSIRRDDGRVVAIPTAGGCYTTSGLLELEQRLVEQAVTTVDAGVGIATLESVEEALARRPTIRGEQSDMVRRLTTSGAGVEVVAAAAGTGKTFGLDAARDAWHHSGYRVIGAALAAEAAHELEAAAGIPSDTIALLQLRLDHGDRLFDRRTVLVIDEAGMVGTRSLAHLLHTAHDAGTKVVLVGDPRQLPEIDAGGVLRGLAARLDPITLTENRRQDAEWERDAVSQLRDGDVDAALAAYQAHGRLVTADTAPALCALMLTHWWQAQEAGQDVRMLALRRSDVDNLNQRARARLEAAAKLHGPTLQIAGRPFQVGDTILCERNQRRLGIRNGTRGKVLEVDPERRTLTFRTTDDRTIELPAAYLEAGHVNYGYATTIHKGQGKTFGRTLTLASDELLRAHGYVAMSRGRDANHLYVVAGPDHDHTADRSTDHAPEPERPEPFELVRQALRREQPKRLAIDTGQTLAAWPVERLVDERDRLQAIFDACPADRTADLRSAQATRDRLQRELEPIVDRYNTLADKRLRGPKTKAEMRTLTNEIDQLSDDLSHANDSIAVIDQAMKQRDAYIERCQPDVQRWETVKALIDDKIAQRVEWQTGRPKPYLLQAIGWPPPSGPALTNWKRDAAAIEAYGLDHRVTGSTPLAAEREHDSPAATKLQRLRRRPAVDTPTTDIPDLGIGP